MQKIWAKYLAILAGLGLVIGIYLTLKPRQTASSRIPAATERQGAEQRVLHYLGKKYVLPVKAEKIVVTGALEALEDLLVLKVKPVGMMSIGGSFPALFAEIAQDAQPIGEKMQPNLEAILRIQPDVIISSDKFPPAITEQLRKIAPTIPISHFPADAEANLRFLGELTGKQGRVAEILEKYGREAAVARARLPESIKNKKVVAVRIRVGNILVYPAQLFFNDILYGELGLPAPEEIKGLKGPEVISLEKFSAMNPDYIFLQYAASESPAHPKVLDEMEQNPIWRSMEAVKNHRIFINAVDPLIQGVALGGKIQFLNAAVIKLSKEKE